MAQSEQLIDEGALSDTAEELARKVVAMARDMVMQPTRQESNSGELEREAAEVEAILKELNAVGLEIADALNQMHFMVQDMIVDVRAARGQQGSPHA